jgi:hypothetical protein
VKRLALALVLLSGCNAAAPSPSPEDNCRTACAAKARRCTENQCARGCNLILDRLLEHEGDTVLACMSAARPPCNDERWADCAMRVGPHADGGPPAPPPRRETEDQE